MKNTGLVTRRTALAGVTALMSAGSCITEVLVGSAALAQARRPVIGMLPKFLSDPYFVAVHQGAQEAAKQLDVTVDFDGPVSANVAAQVDIIDRWVRARVDAITVAALDPDALAPSLLRARQRGIKVSTFDSDVSTTARGVFLNQATFESFGRKMADMMVEDAGSDGSFLVVTGVLTAPNQNRWIDEIKKYYAQRYPKMQIAAILPGDEDIEKSKNVAVNYLRAHPSTRGVFCVAGPAAVGVAEAADQLGLKGKVVITGLGSPNLVRPYIESGTIKQVALWNPVDIGYGAIYIAKAQIDGTLDPSSGYVSAGRLGKLKFISKDVVLLGSPLIIDAGNINKLSF